MVKCRKGVIKEKVAYFYANNTNPLEFFRLLTSMRISSTPRPRRDAKMGFSREYVKKGVVKEKVAQNRVNMPDPSEFFCFLDSLCIFRSSRPRRDAKIGIFMVISQKKRSSKKKLSKIM